MLQCVLQCALQRVRVLLSCVPLPQRSCFSVKTSAFSPSARYGFYQAVTFEATSDERAGWVLSNKVRAVLVACVCARALHARLLLPHITACGCHRLSSSLGLRRTSPSLHRRWATAL